jgi:hypothetical protein
VSTSNIEISTRKKGEGRRKKPKLLSSEINLLNFDTVIMQSVVIWVAMLCGLLSGYQQFKGTYHLHLHS